MIANEIWQFLKSPIFLKNLAAWIIMMGALFFLVTSLLNLYTRHNESVQVGNYIGMSVDEAMRRARDRSFRVVITDSIYIVDKAPNTVLDQDPKPLSRVKQRRRIYLTVTKSTPDEVTLPELVGSYNYDQYTRKLAQLNIRYRIRERQFDSKLEENTIQYFYYKDRKITDADLRDGVEVPMGSTLEFVVTERNTGYVPIPDLVCKTYEAAQFLISTNNLSVGNIYGEVADMNSAYVWRQEPEYAPGQNIRMGEQISIYLTQERPDGCPVETDPGNIDIEETPRDTSGGNLDGPSQDNNDGNS